MKISIIGSGFVGQAVGKGFLALGNEVIFYDIEEKDLPNFTMDLDNAIANSDVAFICVPTPTDKEGTINLDIIRLISQDIGIALANSYPMLSEKYHVIVVKSTVVPGTTEEVVIPNIEKFSSLNAGRDFGICMNPEFMTEISHTWSSEDTKKDFFSEDRIVIGKSDARSGDILEEIYKPLNKPIFRTDLKTAEIIKYASNCMLATKISYWNEIFLICKRLGIRSQEVADIVSSDPRIGKYGTVHGKAFGGKCLPKDLKAFISFAKEYRKPKLLEAVDEINEEIEREYGVRE
ncbi:UDP-glucose/GDP-mannose dehydrogenase family protein [candidate division WOR-3 bacterium]|nr:UDP-glucose/GDP-mannose dehydrogenase family protein [candidate division WOR-3 bacterium]